MYWKWRVYFERFFHRRFKVTMEMEGALSRYLVKEV